MKPHKVIRNMLSQLRFTCRYKENGCQDTVKYDELEIHEKVNCTFAIFDCPEKRFGCQERLKRSEIEKHVKEDCHFSKVECMYCQKRFLRKNLRTHLTDCDMALITCQYCKLQVLKKQMAIHQSAQCEEIYINCGRCQGSFKRKFQDFHDCVRHLLNQQKTMNE